MNFSMNWLKQAIGNTIAFGRKNAPSLMTGGGIILGWTAVYIFWQESKKAEKAIDVKETELPEGETMPVKDKALTYFQYCWPSLGLGVASSVLEIWAHKIDLSRLAEMYVFTQFLEGKNKDQEKMIEKLKGEIPEKKLKKIEDELFQEKFPESGLSEGYIEDTGKGTTLFIDETTGIRFRSSITYVQNAIYAFKNMLREERMRELKRKLGDAFYAHDGPFPDDDADIYSCEGLDVFLEAIGTKQKNRLGDVLEFRDYGYDEFLSPETIMVYKDYIDPQTGVPAACYLRYLEYLSPTFELMERNPL